MGGSRGIPKRGYGRELIEKALTFTLNATTDLGFGGDGISCCIKFRLPGAKRTRRTTRRSRGGQSWMIVMPSATAVS